MGHSSPSAQTLPTFLPLTPWVAAELSQTPGLSSAFRPLSSSPVSGSLQCGGALVILDPELTWSPMYQAAGTPLSPSLWLGPLRMGNYLLFFFWSLCFQGLAWGLRWCLGCEWMRWERKHSDNLGLIELVGVLCRRWGWVGVLAQSLNAWRINANSLEGCACCRCRGDPRLFVSAYFILFVSISL